MATRNRFTVISEEKMKIRIETIKEIPEVKNKLGEIIKKAFSKESLEHIKPNTPEDFFLNLLKEDLEQQKVVLGQYREKYLMKLFWDLQINPNNKLTPKEEALFMISLKKCQTIGEIFNEKKHILNKRFNSEEKLASKAYNRTLNQKDFSKRKEELKEVLAISPMGGKTALLVIYDIAEILCNEYNDLQQKVA